jgi:hypothetical protein
VRISTRHPPGNQSLLKRSLEQLVRDGLGEWGGESVTVVVRWVVGGLVVGLCVEVFRIEHGGWEEEERATQD